MSYIKPEEKVLDLLFLGQSSNKIFLLDRDQRHMCACFTHAKGDCTFTAIQIARAMQLVAIRMKKRKRDVM